MNKPERLPEEQLLTQAELAVVMGVSKSTIEKLERRIVAKLASAFKAHGLSAEDAEAILKALRHL
jgi:transcriptional regulator with XRE-family HTH domain